MRLQEAIHRVKPDVIVETGVAHGGSLIFYASLCKAVNRGRVIGIDVDIKTYELLTAYAKEDGGNSQMGQRYWTNDIIDPDEVTTFGVDPNGGANSFSSYWGDPTATKLVHQARGEGDAGRRARIGREAREHVGRRAGRLRQRGAEHLDARRDAGPRTDDDDKILTTLSYMRGGPAAVWAMRYFDVHGANATLGTWTSFVDELKAAFEDRTASKRA
jgi:hypothetical protein